MFSSWSHVQKQKNNLYDHQDQSVSLLKLFMYQYCTPGKSDYLASHCPRQIYGSFFVFVDHFFPCMEGKKWQISCCLFQRWLSGDFRVNLNWLHHLWRNQLSIIFFGVVLWRSGTVVLWANQVEQDLSVIRP